MKIASGAFERAQPRHQVAVGVGGAALQLARREVEQAHEVVDDAVQLRVVDQAGEARRSTFRPSTAPTCFSVASAIAVSQTFDHGSGDAAKKAIASRLKILSPIGLSSRLPRGQADRPALALVEDALGLEQQRLAEALGADDDELVVAVRA